MTRLFQTGFEENTLTVFNSASGTIVTSPVRNGVYAGRTNPAAGTQFFRYHAFASDQSTRVFMRAYLRVASLPLATTTVVRIANAANGVCTQLLLSTGGALILNDAASATVGSASAALTTGQWYRVELSVDASSSPGTVTAQLDGVQFATGNNSAQAPWSRLLVGVIGSTTADLAWDDWAANDTSGSAQNSWPGAGQIINLLPNADGDNHAWLDTAGSAGTANNYQLVDDLDDATSFVQSVTLNAEDMYNMAAPGIFAGDVVNAVAVGVRYRNGTADATTAFRPQVKKTSGGTISQGTAIVPNSTSFATAAASLVLSADPDGGPWSAATLDTMQAGLKVSAAGVNTAQVTGVWASVDYTPSTAAGPPPPPSTRRYQRLLVR